MFSKQRVTVYFVQNKNNNKKISGQPSTVYRKSVIGSYCNNCTVIYIKYRYICKRTQVVYMIRRLHVTRGKLSLGERGQYVDRWPEMPCTYKNLFLTLVLKNGVIFNSKKRIILKSFFKLQITEKLFLN